MSVGVTLDLVRPLLSTLEPERELSRLEVRQSVSQLSSFVMEFSIQDATLLSQWLAYDGFQLRSPVTLSIGERGALHAVLEGEVTGLEVERRRDVNGVIVVRGYDLRYRLTRGTRSRSFRESSDADIAKQVLEEAGLSAEVSATSLVHAYVQQCNVDDWSFLKERAALHDFELACVGGVVQFRPRPSAPLVMRPLDETTVRSVYLGTSLMDTVDGVVVRGWDAANQAVWEGRAGAVTDPLTGPPAAVARLLRNLDSADEASTLAETELARRQQEAISGTVELDGDSGLSAGTWVKVPALGGAFSGPLYAHEVTHAWSPASGFSTTLKVSGSMRG